MKNYNKAGQKPGVAGKTYAQILEDEEERRRRERQQSTLPRLTNLDDAYKPAFSNSVSMPRLTNLSDLYKPAAAVSGAKSANTGSAASKAKAPQGKSANTFYTNTPNSGTIIPRFNNISEYNKAIEEGNKTLDDLAHRQFQAMLKNDVPAMNALEKQYKDTERYIGSLKAELGEVMGAGIHGPKGNQLTGSGWFGRMMDELSADGGKVHVTQLGYSDGPPPMPQRPPVPEGHPDRETFEKDLKEVLAPEGMDKKGVASSGGGYADFFREQREGDASEDTRKDTGYEYISKQDFDSRLALLETRLGWNSVWLDEADAKLAVNYSDESAQRVYNHCLENTIELKKQIDELKEQRVWSEKVDEAAKISYDSEEDAAVAFADIAVPLTGKEDKEHAAMIIEMDVPVVNDEGRIVMEKKYVLGEVFVGEHDNVIGGLLEAYADFLTGKYGRRASVSFVHTHPYCTGHVANKFSGELGESPDDIANYLEQETHGFFNDIYSAGVISFPNVLNPVGFIKDLIETARDSVNDGRFGRLADYLGDRQVAWLPGVKRMYLASPTEQEIYAVDKNGPIMDPDKPNEYLVIGRFSTKLVGEPYQD